MKAHSLVKNTVLLDFAKFLLARSVSLELQVKIR